MPYTSKRPANRLSRKGITGHEQLPVLVVSGGGFQGLTIMKGLRASDAVRIILADSSSENVGKYFADRAYVVPGADRKRPFLKELLRICKKEKVRLIIPSTDRELGPLAESAGDFERRNIHVAVSDHALLTRITNKRSLYEFLKEHKFPVLPLVTLTHDPPHFPVIGKPLDGWGGRGILILHSREDMKKYVLPELTKNYLWQPYLTPVDEYSIDFAIFFDGTVSEFVTRQRVRTSGGFAVIAENIRDAYIEKEMRRLLNTMRRKGAKGIFNVQILRHGKKYFFSDVNARIGTSALFAYRLGINLPLLLCSSLCSGMPRETMHVRPGKVKMVRYIEELWIEKADVKTIRAFVFDLDDTLINQKAWILGKINILWARFRNRLPGRREFLSAALRIVEEGNRSRLFDALSGEFDLAGDIREELIAAYRGTEPDECPLFPDVMGTLQELRNEGFRLALLTDNPPRSQKQKVKACGLGRLFDVTVYSRETGQEKPEGNVFRAVSERLKIPARFLAMVGDNLHRDIRGALDSGYGSAFWLQRSGTFYNFDEGLFNACFEDRYHFVKIQSLRSLLLYFR